jgi:uncharacterized protein YegP (UPF0339 family)
MPRVLAVRGAMEARYQCVGLGPAWSWRLLGSNHRALARTAGSFATLDEAAADARDVGRLARSATIEVIIGPDSTWRWELTTDGVVRAASAVAYARRLECVRAVARFRECAASAPVAEIPLVRRAQSGRAVRPSSGAAARSGVVEPRGHGAGGH